MTVTGDFTKILAGPCEIKLDGTSIGHTQEGVAFTYTPSVRERTVDEYGETPIELILTGERIEVVARISQWELAKLRVAFPAGVQGTDYQGIGRPAGYELGSNQAKELVIHPLEQSGTTYDVTLWKAVAGSPVEIGYNNEGDRMFEVTFLALADPTKPSDQVLGKIGSPS